MEAQKCTNGVPRRAQMGLEIADLEPRTCQSGNSQMPTASMGPKTAEMELRTAQRVPRSLKLPKGAILSMASNFGLNG